METGHEPEQQRRVQRLQADGDRDRVPVFRVEGEHLGDRVPVARCSGPGQHGVLDRHRRCQCDRRRTTSRPGCGRVAMGLPGAAAALRGSCRDDCVGTLFRGDLTSCSQGGTNVPPATSTSTTGEPSRVRRARLQGGGGRDGRTSVARLRAGRAAFGRGRIRLSAGPQALRHPYADGREQRTEVRSGRTPARDPTRSDVVDQVLATVAVVSKRSEAGGDRRWECTNPEKGRCLWCTAVAATVAFFVPGSPRLLAVSRGGRPRGGVRSPPSSMPIWAVAWPTRAPWPS